MFVFNIHSWHYKLVYYVFGESFFFNEDLDHEKIRKAQNKIFDKTRKEFPNDDNAIEKAHHDFNMQLFHNDDKAIEKAHHDFNMQLFHNNDYLSYTTKKIINFCPYCRAVVTSLVLFPFTALYKLIPKRKPRRLSYEESKKRLDRNSKIARSICGGVNIGLGLKSLLIDNSIEIAIIQFALGIGLIFMYQSATVIGKIYVCGYLGYKKIKKFLITIHIFKEKIKKEKPPKESKPPNFVQAFIYDNHENYFPLVSIVNESNDENLK